MKMRSSVSGVVLLATMMAAGSVLAEGPTCAEAQDDSWLQPDIIQAQVETMGYTIEQMDVSDGNCYAVSGLNTQGERVTAYLDPRTGEIVDEEVAQ